jgi:hypothetical protein
MIDLNGWLVLPTNTNQTPVTASTPPTAFPFPTNNQTLLSQLTLWDTFSKAA